MENAVENDGEVKEECAKTVKPSILRTIKENKKIIENKKDNQAKLTPDVAL